MRLPLRRELRLILWGWTIIAAAGATIGGIIGVVELAREPRRKPGSSAKPRS